MSIGSPFMARSLVLAAWTVLISFCPRARHRAAQGTGKRMDRTVSFVCAAALFILLVLWNAAHAQTPLTADEARAIVALLYDALNQPAKQDVAALLEKAASPNWQS